MSQPRSTPTGGPAPTARRQRSGKSRGATAAAAAAATALLLAGCGGNADAGPPTLTWYINNPAQGDLIERCNQESDSYNIETALLPNDAAGQREQLLRRLAAGTSSLDIMSVDPPYMAELANAEFLRPFTDEERAEFSDGVLEGPLDQAIFGDTMYSAPFYGNTQLLWYHKSVAEEAGLDMSQPVTWDQIIKAAEDTDTTVAAQGRLNESLMVWVNALVESDGGTILEDPGEAKPADEIRAAVDSPAGAEAARIMNTLAESPAAPPALSTAGEEESRAEFQSDNGGFMVNWPYVWAAFDAGIEDGSLPPDFKKDIGWARYPRVKPDVPSATPLGGIGLSIGAFSEHPDLAVEAVRCLRSPESQTAYMLSAGDPAAAEEVYDNPEVRDKFPMWQEIKEGLIDAGPRPITAYYGDVTGVIQQGYHPPDTLNPETTPERTAETLEGVLSNQQLL